MVRRSRRDSCTPKLNTVLGVFAAIVITTSWILMSVAVYHRLSAAPAHVVPDKKVSGIPAHDAGYS